MRRRIGIVIHPGFQLLDATGPIAAFEMASRFSPDGYDVDLLAATPGPVVSSSGLTLSATALAEKGFDTIIVSGGELIRDMEAFRAIIAWLGGIRPRRLASVCSGAFLLAEAGRLDGRLATTHWDSTERFRRLYPRVELEPDRIFTRHGDIWTSAGITAGIDLTLALIEDDLGPAIAQRAAQQLVVHKRRTGGQSQFSALLEMGGHSGRFEKLIAWIKANPAEPLSVEQLAGHMAMSPRNFARAFQRDVGTTPAKAVEKLRVGLAQEAVEKGFGSFEQIARQSGFHDAGQMRRAFLRALGRPPQALRRAP